ncbi:hypothetical protein [Campylobacter cuniculorum]|uniref:Lipoprotein n=2 Tax=Campylobacter cuniculorum TaxID=374106 RepID=A0A1W6BY94_9BACT|nr:hypothetical protein [Campylobacter cuniculorum]ARJ57010.1 hypothetical protein CCUN_1422 [Campylobacter cuniculorum DSM 23162 = LMG 24588]QOR04460.1 hypothetical protein A0071_00455 [Campylobacter cuniculorum]
MKKFLILILIFFTFYGCTMDVSNQTPKETREQALIRMCENENNEQACQALFIEARIACDNYNPTACGILGGMIYTPQRINLFVKNISQKELYKKSIMYLTKSCMLGHPLACQQLEQIKVFLENYNP